MINSDWNTNSLGSLADVIDPHPSHRAPSVFSGGIPFSGIGDFSENGDINRISVRYVHHSVFDEHEKRYSIQEGDIGFGRVATIGKVIKLRTDLLPYAVSPTLAIIKPKSIDSTFLLFALKSNHVKNQIKSLLTGTTRSSLGIELLRSLAIHTPDADSQRIIGKVLSTLDKAIEQTEAIIAKQQRIKTGLMQDLLTCGIDEVGNIRSEATHKFKDSPLGRIPVEWEVRSISNFAESIVDCPHTTPNFQESGILVARTFNIKSGCFGGEYSYVSEEEYHERIQRLEPMPDDIVFTREAPVGEAFVIPEKMKVCLGQRTMLIRCMKAVALPDFLVHQIYSEEMRVRFDRMVGGTTNPHLNVADVRSLLFKCPKIPEQTEILQTLKNAQTIITQNESVRRKYVQQKTGLMQDLLTGKVRVTDLLTPSNN